MEHSRGRDSDKNLQLRRRLKAFEKRGKRARQCRLFIAEKLAREMSELGVNSSRTSQRVEDKFLTPLAATSKQMTKLNLREHEVTTGRPAPISTF